MKIKSLIIVGFVALSLHAFAQDKVLFSVGNQEVTAEEFKAVYEKNKGVGNKVDPKTPEEYLDLYINFKLKIAEAYDLKRDTSSKFVNEFEGYRAQLAKPYLSDSGSEEALIKEAYSRMKEEVRASHIMIALENTALPSDTVKVYKELMNLKKEIESGKLTFEEAARTKSADTWSAKRGGDLGYFTTFSMVYPFESGAYDIGVGEISLPVRSQYGYHLIKTTDRRKASGTVRVRQIFFSANEKADLNAQQRAERSANEIYSRLEQGESFVKLVSFSEDRKTKDTQGEMPEFGLNKMMPAFEEAAFALDNPGDFSKPVRTNIGWHVIQLIEKKPIASFEELEKEIKSKVKRDSRSKLGAAKFVKDLKRNYEFEVQEKNYLRTVKLVDKETFTKGQWKAPEPSRDRVVATFADQKITQSQILGFWEQNQKPGREDGVDEYLKLLFNVVSNDIVIGYEDSKLEEKYPAFRHLVREYKEGILLFDLTQDEVWNKAATDSIGIFDHYEKIKNNFKWEDRVKYTYWVTNDLKSAKRIAKWANKSKIEKIEALLKEEEALSIAVQSGLSEQMDEPVVQALWQTAPGVYGPTELNGGYAVIQVLEFVPSAPKELKEVKGLVIASYQDELEKMWIASLKEKFDVYVHQEVKEQLFNSLAE